MPKYAIRTATALALVAVMSVVAISLLTTGARDATAFNAAERAVPPAPAAPAPPTPPAAPAPPAIPAQYTEQCSNGTAVPNPADNAGLVADCAALLASKSTLDPHGRLDWSADRAVSDWYGITIADNRVSQMVIYGPSLNGRIPAELGNLSSLTFLRLTGHNLTGAIPAELGNLATLTQLWIYKNNLTGEIPSELGNLAKIRELWLGNNKLSGEIPSELGNLATLRSLMISHNQLSGEIPVELGNLSNLRHLGLSYNQLSGEVPSELGNLSNLSQLYLIGNQLTGCIPLSLYEGLRYGSLSQTRDNLGLPFCGGTPTPTPSPTPTGTPPIVIELTPTPTATSAPVASATATPAPTATSVPGATATPTPTASQIAAQCSNGATVPNPASNAGLVADCIALLTAKPTLDPRGDLNWAANRAVSDWQSITTANNRVTRLEVQGDDPAVSLGEIPAELGSLAKLEVLVIDMAGLTGEIPAELGNLANLTTLSLQDNQLSGAVPSELGNLSNLTHLGLSYNSLTGCIPQSLRAAAAAAPFGQVQDTGYTLPFCAAATTPIPTATTAPRRPRPTITPTPTSAPRETPVASPTPTATPAIVIETTPTATPVQGETPVATPTPSATPAIVIEPTPTPTATPTSVVSATDDPCVESLSGSGSANGSWTSACLTANPPNAFDYYARFYTFTLDAASDVTITLSSDATAPYLYLLDGAGKTGAIKRETGAANTSAATITETLQPGTYTIEATTFYAETPGAFTLEFAATPAPAATCAETLSGNASVNGAWVAGCLSANPPNDRDYYARFYTFTLDAAAQVTVTLSSADTAPYLYLLDGAGTTGAIKRETGDANASAATITESLQPGSYTIEATTYYAETTGDFTLEVEIARP